MFSKMTNREQESGGTLSPGDSIRQHLLMPVITVTNGPVKGGSPGVATRAAAVGLMVGKWRWGWGRIARCVRFNLRGYVSSV